MDDELETQQYRIIMLLTNNRRYAMDGSITLTGDEAMMVLEYVMQEESN